MSKSDVELIDPGLAESQSRKWWLCLLKTPKGRERLEILCDHFTVAGMITILSALVPYGFRLRRRASLELELIALRHQVSDLLRQLSATVFPVLQDSERANLR